MLSKALLFMALPKPSFILPITALPKSPSVCLSRSKPLNALSLFLQPASISDSASFRREVDLLILFPLLNYFFFSNCYF